MKDFNDFLKTVDKKDLVQRCVGNLREDEEFKGYEFTDRENKVMMLLTTFFTKETIAFLHKYHDWLQSD